MTAPNPAQRLQAALPLLALAAMALLPWVGVPTYWVTLANYIGIYAIVALGLVLVTGHAGLTSFGQSAFVGIGAYTTAYLASTLGLGPLATLAASLALTTGSALALGLITVRLQGHYLPLCTIAWCLSLFYAFGNIDALGKFDGITGIPPFAIGPWTLERGHELFYLIWGVLALAVVGVRRLLDSRPGRVIRALKKGAVMEESCGIDTASYKLLAFVIAAMLAGVSGWLYAYLQRAVNPTPFGLGYGIEYLFMAVVGGAVSVWGAVLGATFVTLLKTWLQDWLPKLIGEAGQFEIIVFGILLVLILQYAREGLMPFLQRFVPATKRVLPAAGDRLQHRTMPTANEPVLIVDAARKTFGGLVAVSDVTFSVNAREVVGLIGPNGAGKSTCFNLISGALQATSGSIKFMGRELIGQPASAISKLGLARTFQHVKLVATMTVVENVALGAYLRGSKGIIASALRLNKDDEAAALAEAMRQLERVGLAEHAHDAASSLPLGKQRVVEIARALASDPILLLLDEPAAGLRFAEKQQLATLIKTLKCEGVTVLLVEHDMDFVMGLVDRLVVLNFGQKLAQGLPEAVQADPAVREAYLGA